MRLPFFILKNYIDLEHSKEEFGNIMTKLDSMQDGPIKKDTNGNEYIDLEDRKNRPDLLCIIGLVREYAAYINKPIKPVETWEDREIPWNRPKKYLNIQANDLVKRFVAVKIKNIKVSKSPDWLKASLEAYDIPSINNVVDITNFVMLEYGMPLHAFDYKKLKKDDSSSSYLVLRRSNKGEDFETWQKSKLKLDKNDLVISDGEKLVGIAGIIGGLNSGITDSTTEIILESACYDHASIRKTDRKYNLKTDASTLHEKILNPNMVETAIRRAVHLLIELADGDVEEIEDYYEHKHENPIIEFDINEIFRLSGVEFEIDDASDMLTRLGFTILDHKEALAVNTSKLLVQTPNHRTDVVREEALVGEVLRLWGYEKIPFQGINFAPPKDITPKFLILEDRIRDIFVSLGLDEQVLWPITKYPFDEKNADNKQIKLENSLNSEMNGLRSSMWQTMPTSIINYKKYGKNSAAIFEIGRIYLQKKIGEFTEKRVAAVYFLNKSYQNEVKPKFLATLFRLGLEIENVEENVNKQKDCLEYFIDSNLIAKLYQNKFEIYTEDILEHIDLNQIPSLKIQTNYIQKIIEEISILVDKNCNLGEIAKSIKGTSDYIESVEYKGSYSGDKIPQDKLSVVLKVVFADKTNELTKKQVDKIKNEFLDKIKIEYGAKLR